MFVMQVHAKPGRKISDTSWICPKVRERIANLKPGEMGYKVAWERLLTTYGQMKLVINIHVNAIVERNKLHKNTGVLRKSKQKLTKGDVT